MSYPMEWHGSKEPKITSGFATFKVEGREYRVLLPSFSDAMEISKMLDKTFEQGKDFAFRAIKSYVVLSLDKADQAHSLTMTKPDSQGDS